MNEKAGLRYSKVSQFVKDLKKDGKNVLLVDAGDQIQGSSYGAFDQGFSITKIMNAIKYDAATIGNHEFDYGFGQLKKLSRKASFPYLCCNFKSLETGRAYFEAYKIFNAGGKKIAFVGIATPGSITSSNRGTNEI